MSVKRIILLPGDVHFSRAPDQLYTLLGSCLAITAWHPQRLLGGMCHFLLPKPAHNTAPDGRYGSDAFNLLCQFMQQNTTFPNEYRYQIYGGSNILQTTIKDSSIGSRNIYAAKQILLNAALSIDFEDTGGNYSRKILLDLKTGKITVHHLRHE
ncbi:chemotaxis protein CheD [Iodobacter ciconiae]|uniref:Probable chemoreceptor glutamine deamidase CheD n=1 Tax=Iodobacter ciconiae TaxID=2496266 RepID=A0A3S8ZSK0_9NEIS|nr:chemotaxis protein CheD [Iodobacter ciconiae]AZN36395.1 chemotaxis protein CheD [Iodobacter ciconiae]